MTGFLFYGRHDSTIIEPFETKAQACI